MRWRSWLTVVGCAALAGCARPLPLAQDKVVPLPAASQPDSPADSGQPAAPAPAAPGAPSADQAPPPAGKAAPSEPRPAKRANLTRT